LRIGYYWPEKENSLFLQNSQNARNFFLELFDKNLIIVRDGGKLVDINELLKESDYFKISKTEQFNLTPTGKITILQFIRYRLKIDTQSINWLRKYLTEDTKICGFLFTESPYQAKHQNLFQENAKIEDEHFKFANSFLLQKTNNKSHLLYLCSRRTFNSTKVRLVLKSHLGDQVRGIIMIQGLSDSVIKASDKVYIHKNDFEIGHISQIHFKEVRNFYLNDREFNNYEITRKLNALKEKIIEHSEKSDIHKIPVEFHNFIRCEIQSTIKSFKNAIIPSIIGQKLADFNYINNDGIKIATYFSFFKNFSIEEKTTLSISILKNNFYNIYLGTFISKSNNVYIQLHSPPIDWLFYNYQFDFNNEDIGFCGDPEHQDDTFITYAERGYSKIEIDKLKEENQYLEEYFDNHQETDWGLDWNSYNDQLDMDQQDPEFW
jgi:hypothetical protein